MVFIKEKNFFPKKCGIFYLYITKTLALHKQLKILNVYLDPSFRTFKMSFFSTALKISMATLSLIET